MLLQEAGVQEDLLASALSGSSVLTEELTADRCLRDNHERSPQDPKSCR